MKTGVNNRKKVMIFFFIARLITKQQNFKLFVKKQLNIVVIEKYIYRFADIFQKDEKYA